MIVLDTCLSITEDTYAGVFLGNITLKGNPSSGSVASSMASRDPITHLLKREPSI